MEFKHGDPAQIGEIKALDDGWEVSGYPSVYGVVDHGGDVVMRGAFDQSLASGNKVRFLFAHRTDQVIGVPLELKSDDHGLYGRFKISKTQLGSDIHTLLQDKALDSFSIGYYPTETEYDDIGTRLLQGIDLLECSIVALPMLDEATVTSVKSDVDLKATWTPAYVNNLPDSAFASIEPGGKKDSDGKTTPRSLRHYPHHNANGALDLPHLRAALSRIGDASNYQGGKAHLRSHARSEGIGGKADEPDESFAALIDTLSFGELVAVVSHVHEAFSESSRKLLDTLTGNKAALNPSKQQELETLLGTFSGLDAVRSDAQRLLDQSTAAKATGDLELRLEFARRYERYHALLSDGD